MNTSDSEGSKKTSLTKEAAQENTEIQTQPKDDSKVAATDAPSEDRVDNAPVAAQVEQAEERCEYADDIIILNVLHRWFVNNPGLSDLIAQSMQRPEHRR